MKGQKCLFQLEKIKNSRLFERYPSQHNDQVSQSSFFLSTLSVMLQNENIHECHLCNGSLRRVKSDGSAVYMNGDRTTSPVEGRSRCGCGYKHFWNGKEYNNMPERSISASCLSFLFIVTGFQTCFENKMSTKNLMEKHA